MNKKQESLALLLIKGKILLIIVVILFLTGNYSGLIAFFLPIILAIPSAKLMTILVRAFPKVFENELFYAIVCCIGGGLVFFATYFISTGR